MKIQIIIDEKVHQSKIDAGEKVELEITHLGQPTFTRMIGKDSVDLFKSMIIQQDGTPVITQQPEIAILTNTYWMISSLGENNLLILNPKYENGVLSIEAYKRIQGVKVPFEEFTCDCYFTGYIRNSDTGNKTTFPFKIVNNTIADNVVSEAYKKGLAISNTDDDTVGVNLDSINIKEFDIHINSQKGVAFDNLGGFINGKIEVTK